MSSKTALGRGRLRRLYALVAEDSWMIADTLAVMLEEEGACVLGPFDKAADAIACVREHQIDIAIVDLALSDAFADGLVEELAARAIPHVIVTGYDALPTNADSRAIAVLRKPLDMKALVDLLSQVAHREPTRK
jgi:DNA-binding NtrC family response regulator